jgi:AbrB family looped-hinge helix DNA binding protein
MTIVRSTMNSRGQVTIPKPVRDALHLSPGDRVEFVLDDDGRLFLISVNRPVRSLKGMLPKPTSSFTLDEMETAIR